jgi:Lrp/AsnC family leucine-responsive transcriptional regulator
MAFFSNVYSKKSSINMMIDSTDLKILNILQSSARVANAEIARRVGLTPSAILERVRKLERGGVIQGYETRLDHYALGFNLEAFVWVKLKDMAIYRQTGHDIAGLPQVLEVHHMAGEDCYLLKVVARDTKDLASLLERINQTDNVRSTRTNITLEQFKDSLVLPQPKEGVL